MKYFETGTWSMKHYLILLIANETLDEICIYYYVSWL